MLDISEFADIEGIVTVRARSKLGIEELARLRKSDGADFVQFFNPSAVINRVHLVGAYLNAVAAFKEKANIAKSLPIEMLLFVSMTDQIDKAIEIAGAKSKEDFLVFATSRKAFESVSGYVSELGKSAFGPGKIEIAKRYGIKNMEDLDLAVLNAMALSRISSLE